MYQSSTTWQLPLDTPIPEDITFPLFVRTTVSSMKLGGRISRVNNHKQLAIEAEELLAIWVGMHWYWPVNGVTLLAPAMAFMVPSHKKCACGLWIKFPWRGLFITSAKSKIRLGFRQRPRTC